MHLVYINNNYCHVIDLFVHDLLSSLGIIYIHSSCGWQVAYKIFDCSAITNTHNHTHTLKLQYSQSVVLLSFINFNILKVPWWIESPSTSAVFTLIHKQVPVLSVAVGVKPNAVIQWSQFAQFDTWVGKTSTPSHVQVWNIGQHCSVIALVI